MKNVHELTSILVKIFSQDTIPYRHFARPILMDGLKGFFKFQEVEMPFPLHDPTTPNTLILKAGEIELNGRLNFIERMIFEDRKITVAIKADTSTAEQILSLFIGKVNELTGETNFSLKNVLLNTYETTSVAELDINYEKFFNEHSLDFIKTNAESYLKLKIANITPVKFTMEVLFEQNPKLMYEDRLSYAPKNITIEPRIGTTPKEKMFFIATPCNSENHLKFVKQLEKVLR